MPFVGRRRFNVAQEEGIFRVTTTSATTAGDPVVFANGPSVVETYNATTTGSTTFNALWSDPQPEQEQVTRARLRAIEEAQQLDHTRRLVRQRERELSQAREAGSYPFLTHRLWDEQRQPRAEQVQFDFGYQIGQYGDETHERVPIKRKVRVRIAPPRRNHIGGLVDHADNFVDREVTDEDDWEVIAKPFNLTARQIQERMKDRRERMERQQIYTKARDKSYELLKDWLSPNEFRDLMDDGQVHITTGDETYTIKKDPNATVYCRNNKEDRVTGDYCLIMRDHTYPEGDVLLAKIMMIKTCPARFKQIAVNNY